MHLIEFIHRTRWDDIPADVRKQARRCLLDTLGAAIGGRSTDLSRIVHDFAAASFGGSEADLWQDGRRVSPPGAALANGMTVDALDIHDGYRPVKGHAGAALVPALFATLPLAGTAVPGIELLTSLVIGYEVALRAGIALHATACDYHTSGAWNALGCAAITARRMRLDSAASRHALGIAEYHGPRSQMMRVIDSPTMLKDGSGWGAMAGVSAGLLAAGGFSGAPAITVESAEVAPIWADLGANWLVRDQYFKPHAVCYWAQPAVAAAVHLKQANHLDLADIDTIRVYAFHEATRLAVRHPENTEQAQYSLPFPVAAALVHGELGARQLSGEGLRDPQVLALADRVEMLEDAGLNARFPGERLERVEIITNSGQVLDSGEMRARWDVSEAPPADRELREKFRWLAADSMTRNAVDQLESAIWNCADLADSNRLSDLLAAGEGRWTASGGRRPNTRPKQAEME